VIAVPDRPNDLAAKLQEAEAFSGEVETGAASTSASIQLTVEREHYLETGDLAASM
jgi:hypothetical protein